MVLSQFIAVGVNSVHTMYWTGSGWSVDFADAALMTWRNAHAVALRAREFDSVSIVHASEAAPHASTTGRPAHEKTPTTDTVAVTGTAQSILDALHLIGIEASLPDVPRRTGAAILHHCETIAKLLGAPHPSGEAR